MQRNSFIEKTIFSRLKATFPGTITRVATEAGVYVKFDGKNAEIGFQTKAQEARCYFHLANCGEEPFEITENPVFDTCGGMVDVSFDGTLKVEAVKEYLDYSAALGLNMMMLYTEDTYELPDYPQFGHLRGRYTLEELKEIDDYADALGIEIIPCIQTLGHMSQFIKWPEGKKLSDQASVLMVGEESTYAFIEAELRQMRAAFRSDRIHLGMDETWGLGLGNYLRKNGYRNQTEIFCEHLDRVLQIAKKYFARPMIWSDMLFRNEDGKEYSPDYIVPDDKFNLVPKDAELIFWDYYHNTYDFYHKNLIQHQRFENPVSFAGGVWTFDGFAPNLRYTYETTAPALEACIDHEIKTITATLWVSGGGECNLMHGIAGLAVFSEYCYKGRSCTEADVYAASEKLTGINEALWHALSDFYIDLKGATRYGTALFYLDPLVDLMKRDEDMSDTAAIYQKALAVIEAHPDFEHYEYYKALFKAITAKAELMRDLRPAYEQGDRAALQTAARELLPQLIAHYRAFYALFRDARRKSYKPFCQEEHAVFIGGVIQRMEDVALILEDYLTGRIDRIEELETPQFTGLNARWRSPLKCFSALR